MTVHEAFADSEIRQRYYDRLRERIHSFVARNRFAEKIADLLLLVPDVFILLWRLTSDARVNGKDKVLLGTAIAYYIFPFDVVPEAIVGPIGYLDDLVFGVYVLSKLLVDTDVAVLREHWSGRGDVLLSIQKVLDAADSLLARDVLDRLKKIAK